MESPKLYMILLGCKPKGRHTEQHDIFFTIGTDLKSTIPDINKFWSDGGKIHIDSWRIVSACEGYEISVVKKSNSKTQSKNELKLFLSKIIKFDPNDRISLNDLMNDSFLK